MFFIDKIIFNYLYNACENMGRLFGQDAGIGAIMWLILIGGLVVTFLNGKKGKKC